MILLIMMDNGGLLFIDKHKKLIPIKINRVRTVDAVISYDEKHGFKGAVYCADKGSAKLIFMKNNSQIGPKKNLLP